MSLKEIIPEKIDARLIIDFSKDDSIVVLKDSLARHTDDIEKLLNADLYFPAFVSLMSAIEIYFKIHLTIFCFLHTKNLSPFKRKQIEILTGDTKLLNNFQYSVKSRYSHNLIAMIEDLSVLIEEKPIDLIILKSSVAKLTGYDWVNKRYDTESISIENGKINETNESFKNFTKWMEKNQLDILDKVRTQPP